MAKSKEPGEQASVDDATLEAVQIDAPKVPAVLDPDDPWGLLPLSALGDDLAVTFMDFQQGAPGPGEADLVELGFMSKGAAFQMVDEKWYPTSDPIDFPQTLKVPSYRLKEGVYEVAIRISRYGNNPVEGDRKTLTIDTSKPNFGNTPGPVVFPAELGGVVTETYLIQEGEVSVLVPWYIDAAVGDRAEYYWTDNASPPDSEVPIREQEFSPEDIADKRLRITGQTSGIETSGGSDIQLTDTHLSATGASGVGLNAFGAEVRAVGGSMTGGMNGIRLRPDLGGVGNGANVSLDHVLVQGLSGAAILANSGVNAQIRVLNGTQLLAGNSVLLDVQDASTVIMSVEGSTLEGNINIAGNSTGNLTFDQGRMTGDVLVENGSTANVTLQNSSQFTGRLDKVDGVTVNSGSIWTLTGNDTVGTLAMSGGTVRFGAQDVPNTFYQLNVGTLAGSPDGSSTFAMKGNFATGQHDLLNVTGVATGSFGLLVAASGLDAVNPQQLTLVRTAAGDAQFALTGGRVDLGAWSYDLAQRQGGTGGTEWFLDPTTQVISPGASAVLALFNSPIGEGM